MYKRQDFAQLLFSDGSVENAISLDNQLNIIQVADLVLPDKDTTFEAVSYTHLIRAFWIFQSLRKNAGNGNISESPEGISFISRASVSSTERTTENIWDAPFILGR